MRAEDMHRAALADMAFAQSLQAARSQVDSLRISAERARNEATALDEQADKWEAWIAERMANGFDELKKLCETNDCPACKEELREADCAHSTIKIDRTTGIETCEDCGKENPDAGSAGR